MKQAQSFDLFHKYSFEKIRLRKFAFILMQMVANISKFFLQLKGLKFKLKIKRKVCNLNN